MASGVAAFPSAYNTFVPDTESTGNLRVEFSRNPNDFRLNQYAQIVPCDKLTGLYQVTTTEEAGRIGNMNEYLFPDGGVRPLGEGHSESFRYDDYRMKRYNYSVPLGDMTAQQASWDVIAQHLRFYAQKAMTARTYAAVTALTTTGNYTASHTSDVTSLNGASGTWAAATTSNLNIKRCINYGINQIEKDTLSAVDPSKLMLVISPEMAEKMAESGEISDYVKNSPYSGPVITGEWAGADQRGLPATLYGVKVVIENTAYTTSRRGATAARSYVMGNASAALVARVGSLESTMGPTFSSLTMFVHREYDMLVEKVDDRQNKRTVAAVVDAFDVKLTSPASSFLFTGCQ